MRREPGSGFTTIGVPGKNVGGPAGLRNIDITARRVEITGTTDEVRTTGANVDVRDSWIHGLYDDGPPHNDAAHISTGSSNVVFVNNRIDSTPIGPGAGCQTSGIILCDDATIVRNVLTGQASTRINAVKAGKATKLAGNVFAKTTRDAVVKGADQVSGTGNKTVQ